MKRWPYLKRKLNVKNYFTNKEEMISNIKTMINSLNLTA